MTLSDLKKPLDAFGNPIPSSLLKSAKEDDLNLGTTIKKVQIARELRNAKNLAMKLIAKANKDQLLSLVRDRLKQRRLTEESIEEALSKLKASLKK